MASNGASFNRPGQNRFAGLKALQPASPSRASAASAEEVGALHYDSKPPAWIQLAERLGASVRRNSHGEHLSLHCWYGEQAGCYPTASAVRLFEPQAPEEVLDPGRWLFLDTETTGLCGGTGTYPFLVGLAWWEGGGLEVEQLFMREYSEEPSLLEALSERLEERPVLVTFNGKSFDWPLLETRYRMTRSIPPPIPRAHLDFLHPARNLWRLRLGSVRLSQLERHVLGRHRDDDVPSEQIPAIYLDFVRGGRADPLVPVFLHNQLDLRGLAGLSCRILSLLDDTEADAGDGLELFGISRMCERRGDVKRARRVYQQSLDRLLPAETERAARAALARLAKRAGDTTHALELWESMLGNSREGYDAYERLAIYYEHEAREPQRALAITREALALLRQATLTVTISPALLRNAKKRFEHRLARLERKVECTRLDMFGETKGPR